MIEINTLWIGDRLTIMEILSLVSHIRNGHHVFLWNYGEIKNIPSGVENRDASEIIPADQIFSYRAGEGKGSFSAFSNLFRYRLLLQNGGWWCDADLVVLKPFDFLTPMVFASERHRTGVFSPTTCVICVPPQSPLMKDCCTEAEGIDRNTVEWGTIGPKLLAKNVYGYNCDQYIKSPRTFCPVDWFESEIDPPLHRDIDLSHSYAIHLWHEMWRRKGLDKDGDYPGSIYDRLKNDILSI